VRWAWGFGLPALGLALVLAPAPAQGQELEPRAYSASPVGANFFLLALGRSSGSVVFDPTLPVTDVRAKLGGVTLGLGRTFGLLGRQALVTVALPYAWGDIEGKVGEEAGRVSRSGLADLRIKLSVNLRGSPALSPREFASAPRRIIVGTSLLIAAPTGQYDNAKLINLGTNRWAFKPEVGLSHPVGKWYFDAYAGVWLFTANDRFYPESRRRQDPVFTLQAHASYTLRPRLWAAFDVTWFAGGEAQVDDQPPAGFQNNSRLGATLSLPIGRRQSVKIAYNNGVSTRTGTNFSTLALAWQVSWFARPQ